MAASPKFEPGDILVSTAAPWSELVLFWVLPLGVISAEGKPPPSPQDSFVKPSSNTPAGALLARVDNLTSKLAAKRPADIPTLLTTLETELEADPGVIEGCLRILVANGTFEVTPAGQRTPDRISLSAQAGKHESRRSYAAGFAHDLVEQSQQVGRLIGHNPTKGAHRETLLRELLQRHLPRRFHVATGFIDGCANQIDILIYDQMEYSALFRAGDLVVVAEDAVRALIEVKSDLNGADTLRDALTHLTQTLPLTFDGPPVFAGIFAFEGATTDFIMDEIKIFHRMLTDEDLESEDATSNQINDHQTPLVQAVCVLKQALIVTGFSRTGRLGAGMRVPSVWELRSIAGRSSEAAIFFEMLSRHLRHPWSGPAPDRSLGAIIAADVAASPARRFYEDESWGPYMTGEGIAPFEAWCDAYDRWLSGETWS